MFGGVFWFTSALAVAELVSYILLITRIKNIWFYFFVSCILAIVISRVPRFEILGDESLPWYYRTGILSCPLIAMGGVLNKYEKIIDSKFKGGMRYVWVLSLLTCFLSYVFFPSSFTLKPTRGEMNIMGYLLVFIESISLIQVVRYFFSKKLCLMNYMGRHSLGMYFLCGAVPNFTCILLKKYLGPDSVTVLFIATIVSLIITVLIVWYLYRKVPFLFDIGNLKL